jgi:DNA-binding PadR family transcriptional regulator
MAGNESDHQAHHGLARMGGGMGVGFGVRRGEFRYLILIALGQKPMHGYALIQEIGRTYQRPVSPGKVYPMLHELEDVGFVTSEEKEGKKVYSITVDGENYLKENEEVVSRLKAGQEYAGKVGQFSFMRDIRDIQAMIMMNADYVDKEKMERIEGILIEAKRKVAGIVFQ